MRNSGMYEERLHATEIGLLTLQVVNHLLGVDSAHQIKLLHTELDTIFSEVLFEHIFLCCCHEWVTTGSSFRVIAF